MLFSRILTVALLGGFVAAAQEGKPNLSGNWHLKEPAKTASAMTMLIEQKGGVFHVVKTITSADGKEHKLEYKCTTDGKECPADGAKVSLYFDGASLVEMDAGEVVSKVVMKLEGDALKIQVTHIYPDGEAENYVLAKI